MPDVISKFYIHRGSTAQNIAIYQDNISGDQTSWVDPTPLTGTNWYKLFGITMSGQIIDSGDPIPVSRSVPGFVTWGNVRPSYSYSSVAISPNGDLVVVGTFGGAVLIDKYRNGALLWSKTFGNGGAVGQCVAIDASNNIFVGGSFVTQIDFGGSSTAITGGSGFTDMFVAKFSIDGVCQWAHGIIGELTDSCKGIALDSSGDVYATGSFTGTAVEFGNSITHPYVGGGASIALTTHSASNPTISLRGSDIWLAKFINATGVTSWAKNFGGPASSADGSLGVVAESGYGVAINASNEVYLCGTAQNGTDFGGGARSLTGLCAFLAKFTTSGGYTWDKTFASVDRQIAQSVCISPDLGQPVITGWFGGAFGGSITFPNGGSGIHFSTNSNDIGDIFIAKFDTSGNAIWANAIHGSSPTVQDAGNGVVVSPVNNFIYFTGNVNGAADFGGGSIPGNYDDAFVVKLLSSGGWPSSGAINRRFGSTTGSDSGSAIAFSTQIGLIVVGRCYGVVNFDGQASNASGPAAFIIRIAP